ncbi:MAG: hypothetical protein M1825_002565 [Sarcosagium campestre]|nr:MAG: hypothetical protein M1825_002565 [Sarcosagium campestre]
MVKEKSINPAQAQRKLEKQKALKKGKAEQAARRTEKLARRNPERLQRQLDDLRAVEASGQALNTRDKKQLEELERDVKAVRKARETLGDKAPQLGGRPDRGNSSQQRGGGNAGRGGGALGKRRRDDTDRRNQNAEDSDSSTTSSVRNIPMPRDTPPPIPPEFLRPRQGRNNPNPNLEPLPDGGRRIAHELPPKPEAEPSLPKAQTVYEAKPIVRDLRKEAVSAFIPAAVRSKIEASRGKGKLVEPDEMQRLEEAGYGGGAGSTKHGSENAAMVDAAPRIQESGRPESDALEEEQKRFERELHAVQIEEVDDAGD